MKRILLGIIVILLGCGLVACTGNDEIEASGECEITSEDDITQEYENDAIYVAEEEAIDAWLQYLEEQYGLASQTAAALETAEEWEIPVFEIPDLDRYERMIVGDFLPSISSIMVFNNFWLVYVFLNNEFVTRLTPLMVDSSETFLLYELSYCQLPPPVEGQNEITLAAIGETGIVTGQTIVITSDQTTPDLRRRSQIPSLRNISLTYPTETPAIAIVSMELPRRDFGEVFVSAHTFDPFEFHNVYLREGGAYELILDISENIELWERGRIVTITVENEWGMRDVTISIQLKETGLEITSINSNRRLFYYGIESASN